MVTGLLMKCGMINLPGDANDILSIVGIAVLETCFNCQRDPL